MLTSEEMAPLTEHPFHEPHYAARQSPWKIAYKNKSFCIGIGLFVILLLIAIIGPSLSPYHYATVELTKKNNSPSLMHILGTDDLGRDLFTRIAIGLRVSLGIGIAAACIDLLIGVSVGLIAGYFGGRIDLITMRIAEFVYSVPYLLTVIFVAALIGPGFFSIMTAMCCIGWIQMARLTRIQVLQIKQLDFIIAARAIGIHPLRIALRHILPNIASTLFVLLLFSIPQAIFAEAFLSFLGIGIQPPLASLGSMTSEALSAMRFYPWRLFIPAGTITFVILAFHLVGDTLRDLLNPKQQQLLNNSHVK